MGGLVVGWQVGWCGEVSGWEGLWVGWLVGRQVGVWMCGWVGV